MPTKQEMILDPQSDWNQAKNDEPLFVLRAVNWKAALMIISMLERENSTSEDLLETALDMRSHVRDNDIPF